MIGSIYNPPELKRERRDLHQNGEQLMLEEGLRSKRFGYSCINYSIYKGYNLFFTF